MHRRTRHSMLLVLACAVLAVAAGCLPPPEPPPEQPPPPPPTTAPPATPTPVDVTARAAANGRAIVRWRPGTGAPTYQYTVQTREGGNVVDSRTVAGTDTVVPGLISGHTYDFNIVPSGPNGTGTPSNSNTVTAMGAVAPLPVQTVAATADATTNEVTVRWEPPLYGPAPETYNIGVWENAVQVGAFVCYAPCDERTVPLTPGSIAFFTIDVANPAGRSPGLTSAPVTVAKPCPIACLSVDATTGAGDAKLRGAGFLNSIGPKTDPDLVAALHPQHWRTGSLNRNGAPQQSVAAGARLTELLSDDWWETTSPGQGGAAAPWADWNRYADFVTGMVHSLEAEGVPVEYWDVQNEPGAGGYYAPGITPTVEQLLTQFKVAYQAIKAADPDAKVVVPSLDAWSDQPDETPGKLDMRTFLDYAALNGLQLDAVSFHDINFSHRPDEYAADWQGMQPDEVGRSVDRLRKLVADRPSLGHPAILVNEYADPYTSSLPGWSLGRVAELEAANVDGANRACWGTCADGYLDGLLAGDGHTTMPHYWLYAFYASMTGVRAPVTTTFSGVTAFAVVDGDTLRVLAGRHEGCRPDLGTCPNQVTPLPGDLTLSVKVRFTGAATITMAAIPAENTPLPAPVRQQQVNGVVAPDGTVQVTLPQVADGEAWQVTIAPT